MHRLLAAFLVASLATVGGSPAEAQFVSDPNLAAGDWNEFIGAIYTGIAEELNEDLDMPRSVVMTATSCDVANAYFISATQGQPDQILMCTELLNAMAQGVRQRNLGETLTTYAVTSQIMFVLLHEVGHALVRVLELPVVGQEEDVADQLATLLFSTEPVLAMWAAEFWSSGSSAQYVTMGQFADEHDLDQQRYFNILCWSYGADPYTRAYIVSNSQLPAQRATRCADEYSRMRRGFESLLSPHLKDPSAFDELDPTRNASGHWRFIEAMESVSAQVRCSASGTLELWQLADEISGSMRQEGTCLSQMVPVENNAEATIASGVADEQGVTFTIEGCTYRGTFSDDTRMLIEGTMTCELAGADPLVGTWRAVR